MFHAMGLNDRDYMKRPVDDDVTYAAPADERLEAMLSGFLRRHPRFFLYVGIGLVVVIIMTLIIARLTSN